MPTVNWTVQDTTATQDGWLADADQPYAGAFYVDEAAGASYYAVAYLFAGGAFSGTIDSAILAFSGRTSDNSGANGTCRIRLIAENSPADLSSGSPPSARTYRTAFVDVVFPTTAGTVSFDIASLLSDLLAAGYSYTGTQRIGVVVGSASCGAGWGSNPTVAWRMLSIAGTTPTLTITTSSGGTAISRAGIAVGLGSAGGARSVAQPRSAQAVGAGSACAAGSVSASGSASGVGASNGATAAVARGSVLIQRAGASLGAAITGAATAVDQQRIATASESAAALAFGSASTQRAAQCVDLAASSGARSVSHNRIALSTAALFAAGRWNSSFAGANIYTATLAPAAGGVAIDHGNWNWTGQSLGFSDVAGNGEVVVCSYTLAASETSLWATKVSSTFELTQTYLGQLSSYNYGARLLLAKQSADGKVHVIYQDPTGVNYLRLALTRASGAISGATVEARFLLGSGDGESRVDLDFQAGSDASQWILVVYSHGGITNTEGIKFLQSATNNAGIVGWDGTATRTNLGAYNDGPHEQGQRVVALPDGNVLVLTGEVMVELATTTMRRRLCTRSGSTWALGSLVTEPTFIGHMCGISRVGSTVYRAAIGDPNDPRIVFDSIDASNAITYNAYPAIPVGAGSWGGHAQISHSADGSRMYLAAIDWNQYQHLGYYDGSWHTQTSGMLPITWLIGAGGVMWDRGCIIAICNAYDAPNNVFLAGVIDTTDVAVTLSRSFLVCSSVSGAAVGVLARTATGTTTTATAPRAAAQVATAAVGRVAAAGALQGAGSAGAQGAGIGLASSIQTLTGAGTTSIQAAGKTASIAVASGTPSVGIARSGQLAAGGALSGVGGLGALRDAAGLASSSGALRGAGATSALRDALAASSIAPIGAGQQSRAGLAVAPSGGSAGGAPSVARSGTGLAATTGFARGIGGVGELRDGLGVACEFSALLGVGLLGATATGYAAANGGGFLAGTGEAATERAGAVASCSLPIGTGGRSIVADGFAWSGSQLRSPILVIVADVISDWMATSTVRTFASITSTARTFATITGKVST